MRIVGMSLEEIEKRHAAVTAAAQRAVRQTLHEVANSFTGVVTVDDLAPITQIWRDHAAVIVDEYVKPAFWAGVDHSRGQVIDELVRIVDEHDALAAGASPSDFNIPSVPETNAEQLLANASNRLVDVGNTIWEDTRSSLLDGLKAGQSVDELAAGVTSASGFGATRAELIARSEVGFASNRGSLAQMQGLGIDGMIQEWIAIIDDRTRTAHRLANGEKVPLGKPFSTGDSPGEAYNCRCTTGYDIPDDSMSNLAGIDPTASDLSENDQTLALSGDQAASAFDSKMTDYAVGSDERTALRDYTSNDQYFPWINGYLRDEAGDVSKVPDAYAKMINEIENSMGSTTHDVQVFRGLQDGGKIFGKSFYGDGSLTGTEFTEYGFTSTSTSEFTAASYADAGAGASRAPVLMEVYMPNGTRSILIDTGGESEVLLPHATQYKILKDEGWATVRNQSRIEIKVRKLVVQVVSS